MVEEEEEDVVVEDDVVDVGVLQFKFVEMPFFTCWHASEVSLRSIRLVLWPRGMPNMITFFMFLLKISLLSRL